MFNSGEKDVTPPGLVTAQAVWPHLHAVSEERL